jgi:hypothetical protein
MNDVERVLEAIEVLTQQVDNLSKELSGLRTELRLYDADQEALKKKAMASNWSYTPPSLNLPNSRRGNSLRNAAIG